MLVLNFSNFCIWNLQKKVWTIIFLNKIKSCYTCGIPMLLGNVEIEYWLEIGLVVLWLKCFSFLLALWAARDHCGIKYCFQSIGLSIIRRHSNMVWQWFSSVSTWIHHGGRQHVFIKWLAYSFTVTQIWTVDGFCRLFFRVKAHWLTCIYMLDQTKVRKINVMRRGSGKFKVMFPLLNKRIRS